MVIQSAKAQIQAIPYLDVEVCQCCDKCAARAVCRSKALVQVNRPEARGDVLTYESFPVEANRALFELRRRALHQTDVSRLDMPALLLYSTGDQVCSWSAVERHFDRMPAAGKRTVAFRRSNHHILRDYDREDAVRAVVDFVTAR